MTSPTEFSLQCIKYVYFNSTDAECTVFIFLFVSCTDINLTWKHWALWVWRVHMQFRCLEVKEQCVSTVELLKRPPGVYTCGTVCDCEHGTEMYCSQWDYPGELIQCLFNDQYIDHSAIDHLLRARNQSQESDVLGVISGRECRHLFVFPFFFYK